MKRAELTSRQDRKRRRARPRRRGMSLIEVMLATAMLLSSVMVLSRMAFLAQKHAHGAEDRSLSQTYCQNIMEEIRAGARPLQNVAPERLEDDVWIYMVKVEPVDEADLTEVAVTVDRLDDPESMPPKEDEMQGYRLVRWIRGKETETASQELGGLPEPRPMESLAPVPIIEEEWEEHQAPDPFDDEGFQPFDEGFQPQPRGGRMERDRHPQDMPPELW